MVRYANNKHCIIIWNVDDLKILYADSKVVSVILADIDTYYGKIKKMVITRGKIHKYLGMTIDYSYQGKLIFSIVDYIGKILYEIPEYTRGESSTPAVH